MGMWKLEGNHIKSGNKFISTEKIRFKNLHCNKYMSIVEDADSMYKLILETEVTPNS